TVRTDPVGAVAVLPHRQQAALDEGQEGRAKHDHQHDDHRLDDGDQDGDQFRTQPAHAWASTTTSSPLLNSGVPCAPATRPTQPALRPALMRTGSCSVRPLTFSVAVAPSARPRRCASAAPKAAVFCGARAAIGALRALFSSLAKRL